MTKEVIWEHKMYPVSLEYYSNLDALFLTVSDTGYDLSRKEVDEIIKVLSEIKEKIE